MRGFVARDKDDEVYLYTHKPYKSKLLGYWFLDYSKYPNGRRMLVDKLYILTDINPQWEDTEPIEVEISINRVKK